MNVRSTASGKMPRWDWRLFILRGCVALAFTILLAQLWRLQIVEGHAFRMAIGQGFVLATPLQVANATNAIANGGMLLEPRLVASISDAEDNHLRAVEPVEIRRLPVDEANLALVREGMKAVMTADDQMRKINVPELKVAGKTGTAEFPGPKDENGIMPTHGWFTAFAPYDNPEVSVTVFLQRGGGPSNAAPVAMEILKRYFHYAEPSPASAPKGLQPTR